MTMNEFTDRDREFMQAAIDVAREGVEKGQSPFGACIVRDGTIVASAHNEVMLTTDITAHAEVQAIRAACLALGKIDLSGCSIYSTCEPCPMCFAACHWARLDRIVFGAMIADAAGAGFNELTISNFEMKEIGGSGIEVDTGCLSEDNKALFRDYVIRPDHVVY